MAVGAVGAPNVLVLGDAHAEAILEALESRLSRVNLVHERQLERALEQLKTEDFACVVCSAAWNAPALSTLLEAVDEQPESGEVVCYIESKQGTAQWEFEDISYRPATFHATAKDVLIDHVERFVTERHREEIIRALQRSTQELFHATSTDQIAEAAVDTANRLLGHPFTSVFQYTEREDGFDVIATTDERQTHGNPPQRIPAGDSLTGIAFGNQRPVYFDTGIDTTTDVFDVESVDGTSWLDELIDLEAIDIRPIDESDVLTDPSNPMSSGFIFPLGTYGTLGVVAIEPQAFTVDDFRFLSVLADTTTAALERTERERALEETNDRLEAFAAIVSHDLRNPLAVATGKLQLLEEECDSDHIEGIDEALGRMDNLIEDVLTLVRNDIDGDDLEWVSLGVIANRAWETVDTADASLELATDVGSARAVDGPLQELFENVFDNAVTHGGTDVTVRIEPLEAGGFAIEDDGQGIDDVDGSRLFEYGYTSSGAGTGLGLAIVERIASVFDWEVTAHTGADGGLRLEFQTFDQ
ncbi:GAF domain-containing sensor histidine kinase [Halobacteria archaeon AArc-curdl1]|uniref:histidine kinase n=1 Tax=Natronosalvus hydrolyticus TaxID=2979988 RepID=A0AAP2Z8R7_9EURY|nr:GAF domain-containing sensor histidine kinase [Halobacteria archaeon AArc-curdl1]